MSIKENEAYCYHPETGEYIGITARQKDPLGGGYLLPGCATLKEPPPDPGQGKARVFAAGHWQIVPDLRRQKRWNKTTLEMIEIIDLDYRESPEFTNTEPPDPVYAYWGGNDWKIDEARKQADEASRQADIADEAFRDKLPTIIKEILERLDRLEATDG